MSSGDGVQTLEQSVVESVCYLPVLENYWFPPILPQSQPPYDAGIYPYKTISLETGQH